MKRSSSFERLNDMKRTPMRRSGSFDRLRSLDKMKRAQPAPAGPSCTPRQRQVIPKEQPAAASAKDKGRMQQDKVNEHSQGVVVIITTDHWTRQWFEDLVLPECGVMARSKVEWFDISNANETFDSKVERLINTVLRDADRRNAVCFAVTDSAMDVYSCAVESLAQERAGTNNNNNNTNNDNKNNNNNKSGSGPLGSSFISFTLTNNKLACRKRVDGGGGLAAVAVRKNDFLLPTLPDGVDGFFKPLDECGNKGVMHLPAGSPAVPNPFYQPPRPPQRHQPQEPATVVGMGGGQRWWWPSDPQPTVVGMRGMTWWWPADAEDKRGESTGDTVRYRLAARHAELSPFMDEDLVGLVEEYVAPGSCRKVCIDGFVREGEVHHYCISDNVYKKDEPEVFDCLVTPAQGLTSSEMEACWALYDRVVNDMVRRGLDNQFFDVEAFVMKTKGPEPRVEVMKVNCRTFSNQLPVFSKLFGGAKSMFATALDLLRRRTPSVDHSFAVRALDQGERHGRFAVGVCAYLPQVEGAPAMLHDDVGNASYFAVADYPALVYAYGKDQASARRLCDEFRAQVSGRYAVKVDRSPQAKKRKLDPVFTR